VEYRAKKKLLGGLKGIMLEVIKNLDVPVALAKSENIIK
jgi:hypothetical protein